MTISRLLFLFIALFPSLALAQAYGGIAGRIASVGTWTPAVTAAGTPGTPAYTTQVGSFVKIGTFVHAQFNMVLSGWTGTPAGNVTITGLPFTSTATTSDNGGCIITQYTVTGLAASNWGITATIAPSATVATLLSQANAGTNNVTAAQTGTTPTLIGFCNYHL